MGASLSKSSSESINRSINSAITNVIVSKQQSCATSTSTNQSIGDLNITGSNGVDIGLTSNSKISLTCLSQLQNDLDMKNKMKTALEAVVSAEAKSTSSLGLNVSVSNSKSYQESVNNIVNNFDIKSVQNCASSFAANQQIGNVNIGSSNNVNIQLTITSDQLLSCVSSDTNIAKAVTDLATEISSDVKAKSTSALFDAYGLIACVICCVVILCSSCLSSSIMAVSSSAGGGGSSPASVAGMPNFASFPGMANFGPMMSAARGFAS